MWYGEGRGPGLSHPNLASWDFELRLVLISFDLRLGVMSDDSRNSTWLRKFQNAFRGIKFGMRGGRTNSFFVHIPIAIATIILALIVGVSKIELSILLLCIATVISAELFNSSIERLAASITKDHDEEIGKALDIASGAVLVVSIFAAIIGLIVFVSAILGGWNRA